MQDRRAVALTVAYLGAALLGVNEVLILLGAGVIGMGLYAPARRAARTAAMGVVWGSGPSTTLLSQATTYTAAVLSPWLDEQLVRLALFFLKVGALLFGSGMVRFAFIQRDVVTRYGWLTQQQLLDAIAVGQMTPGPVLSSATFIGYLVAGVPGAVVATFAIFLPSFVITALVGAWIPRLRRSAVLRAFLRGVNAAVVALILAVSVSLFRAAIVDVWTALLLRAGLVALVRFGVETLWLVGAGAAFGLIHYLVG